MKGDEDWAVERCGNCGEKHLIITEVDCREASRLAAPAPTEAGDPYWPGALLDELDACDVILDGEGK